MMKTPSLVDNSFSRRDMPSFEEQQQRSCDQWQLWARESRTVNKMTSFHSRSTRGNLLQDEAVEPAILKHMMQHRDSSTKSLSKLAPGNHHHLAKKTRMDKQSPIRRCPRPSHSFHSVDRKSLFSHDSDQKSFNLGPASRFSERFLGQDDRTRAPLHHEAESSDFVRTGSQRRRRRADIAVEQEPTSYGNGISSTNNNNDKKDDCCLEYTHSMILQQEAILQGIRREERKQEAIRKKLQEEEALRATKINKNMTEGHGFLSTKKPESSLTGRHQQSHSNNRRASCSNTPTPTNITSNNHSSPVPRERDFSRRNQSSSEVIRVHGRRVKVYSDTRVQDAMERGDSVFLLRCIECNKQLLATKDLTMIFCSACKSLFPTQLGKEVCSTRLGS